MITPNKLGLTDAAELAKAEERISKAAALSLWDKGQLRIAAPAGSFAALAAIHECLFSGIYEFAGQVRSVNLAKGGFRFAPALYLREALAQIEKMPQRDFDEIVAKYVEMNVANPFREGNGRSMRLWLDQILQQELGRVVDWAQIDPEDYLLAMERSPVRDTELKALLRPALTDAVTDRGVFMKGLDASYEYEGQSSFCTADLADGAGEQQKRQQQQKTCPLCGTLYDGPGRVCPACTRGAA